MKRKKQLNKLLKHPTDLTYKDVDSILCRLGYKNIKCSGTNMTYQKGNKKLSFHIPHRYETFQAYQITKLLKDLKEDINGLSGDILKNE